MKRLILCGILAINTLFGGDMIYLEFNNLSLQIRLKRASLKLF